MSYYLVSFKEDFKKFQERLSFLGEALWLDTPQACQEVLHSLPENSVFFIDFANSRTVKDNLVLALRESGQDTKIIYVTDPETQNLQAHQDTPTGGDAYVPVDISEEKLLNIISSLGSKSGVSGADEAFELSALKKLKEHPLSCQLDQLFSTVIQKDTEGRYDQNLYSHAGDNMSSDKNDELSLEDMGEFELTDLSDPEDEGSSHNSDSDLSLSDEGMELSLGDDEELLSLDESPPENPPSKQAEEVIENLGELDFGDLSDLSLDGNQEPEAGMNEEPPAADFAMDHGQDLIMEDSLDLSSSDQSVGTGLSLAPEEENSDVSFSMGEESELSEEVKGKLKEIDAIMDGSSKIDIKNPGEELLLDSSADDEDHPEQDLNQPLVSDDINVDELDFSQEEQEEVVQKKEVEKPKRKKKETREDVGDIREITGAYTGELERMQATISNLRADRDELLSKIQHFEDEQVLHKRQTLSLRAELDEKKIELSIIRRKLNDEVSDLKDRMRVHDEKRLILEEKNRILQQELEKAGHRSKLDVKKIQMRERELEQKLELLKADAETQIRNRDLKILELKRKIDGMEFDMESISTQEKKSVESRYELEDKLDKAIKTLRSAITVLEDEGRSSTLEALKKNIDV